MRTVNIHGFSFLVEPEPSDYWGWIESGIYHADFRAIERFSSRNTHAIDAGAWVGAHTLFASRLYNHVHAIEPDPVALEILRANLKANQVENVSLYEGALTDHAGTTELGGSMLGCSCTRASCLQNRVTVPCTTLREFAQDIPDPLFIKMDVEGAEAQILKDREFFRQRKPDLFLSTHLEWWQEAGSDGRAEFETINQVARLYRNAVHLESYAPVGSQYTEAIFTDK